MRVTGAGQERGSAGCSSASTVLAWIEDATGDRDIDGDRVLGRHHCCWAGVFSAHSLHVVCTTAQLHNCDARGQRFPRLSTFASFNTRYALQLCLLLVFIYCSDISHRRRRLFLRRLLVDEIINVAPAALRQKRCAWH